MIRKTTRKPLGLLDLIPKLNPRYVAPKHLTPLIARLECALDEPLRIVSSVPPRYGKTTTLEHFIVWLLLIDPTLEILYVTYSQRIGERKSAEMLKLAKRAGVKLDAHQQSKDCWLTTAGGGVWVSSPGGSNTGVGARVVVCDDLIRGRADAESSLERQKLLDTFNADIFTRADDPSCSFIVNGTRWHQTDILGSLIARGWERVSLPAIDAKGNALWPERWPVHELLKIQEQIGPYDWASLFLGEPNPRGGMLFRDVYFYTALPEGVRYGIGFDLAYSTKARADFSVAVVLAELDGVFYVVDMVRGQMRAPDFAAQLQELAERYQTKPCTYIAGAEQGVIDMIEKLGLATDARKATADKHTRAQVCAAAWNAKKILVPHGAPWLDTFCGEVLSFSGVKDLHDDIVDALVGAHAAVFDAGDDLSDIPWATFGAGVPWEERRIGGGAPEQRCPPGHLGPGVRQRTATEREPATPKKRTEQDEIFDIYTAANEAARDGGFESRKIG